MNSKWGKSPGLISKWGQTWHQKCTSQNKQTPLYHCHDNSFAASLVLNKTEIPSLCLINQRSSILNHLLRREQYGHYVCSEKVANGDIWFLTEKDWSQEYYWHINGCHFVSFVMYISCAKFEEHCSNISRDILDS